MVPSRKVNVFFLLQFKNKEIATCIKLAKAEWAIDSEPIRARGIIFKYLLFTVQRNCDLSKKLQTLLVKTGFMKTH